MFACRFHSSILGFLFSDCQIDIHRLTCITSVDESCPGPIQKNRGDKLFLGLVKNRKSSGATITGLCFIYFYITFYFNKSIFPAIFFIYFNLAKMGLY